MLHQLVLGPERLRDRVQDEARVAERGKPDPEDAVCKVRHQLGRRLERKPGLARAARPRQRHHADTVSEQRGQLLNLPLPAHERARRRRQVRIRDRLQRREALRADLEQPRRLGKILQPVLAKITDIGLDQVACRPREQHLPAVSGRRDARAQMHVGTDVTLRRDVGSAGMNAHPHPKPAGSKLFLPGLGCRDRRWCSLEGNEEGVALRVDLDPAVRGKSFPQNAPMLGERLRVRFRAEVVQQLRRPLDIGEEEGDRSLRQVAQH